MKVWNLVMASYFGGDGMTITDCLTFKTKDAAIDQMNWVADANNFLYDSSDLRDPKFNVFNFYTRTGRQYQFAIIEAQVYSKAKIA